MELSAVSATKPTENSLEEKLKLFSTCRSLQNCYNEKNRNFGSSSVDAGLREKVDAYDFSVMSKLDIIYLRYDFLALD